jgi:hypothetical protein
MRNYRYVTTCVTAPGPEMQRMEDSAVEVTLRTIRRHLDPDELRAFEQQFGYVRGRRDGLKLANDYCVTYYRSKYKGLRCYYIDHSCIFHI